MEIEELKEQIIEAEEKLDNLRKQLRKEENEKFLNEMGDYVGKYYEECSPSHRDKLVYVQKANPGSQQFFVTDIEYDSMLIGNNYVSISNHFVHYASIVLGNLKEISKEEFTRRATQLLKFGLEDLKETTGITVS